MTKRGEVLVAILNRPRDAELAHKEHWYRIPIESQMKWITHGWPPKWIAFYHTKAIGEEAHAIHFYAEVTEIQQMRRKELLPKDRYDKKAERLYHKLTLGSMQRLERPIPSPRLRRIIFIETTWGKLIQAEEINDLYDDSSLENRVWEELKRLKIQAVRQEWVDIVDRSYALDFAVYCAKGKLDIETDGDEWHANPERAAIDNLRDNDLESQGWQQLRFTTRHVQEQMNDYCIPTIAETINTLGGVQEEGRLLPRKINPKLLPGMHQASLFDLDP